MLGLYGQNGSGKTSFVQACSLLKSVMSGYKIPDYFVNFIAANQDCSQFKFSFVFKQDDEMQNEKSAPIFVDYSFKIGKQEKIGVEEEQKTKYQVKIFDELIKVSCASVAGYERKKKIIDSSIEDSYSPAALLKDLRKKTSLQFLQKLADLSKYKYFAENTAVSAIFFEDLLKIFLESSDQFLKCVLQNMKVYALAGLLVVTKQEQNLFDFGLQAFKVNALNENNKLQSLSSYRRLLMPLSSHVQIPIEQEKYLEQAVESLNGVLKQIIKNFKIELKKKWTFTNRYGKEDCYFDIFSVHEDSKIPLDYESQGLKKIICIVPFLIAVFNNSDTTVVIDDLDAGIFEYLFGELLSVLAEQGKGQFFFTAHNLRPLEVLAKEYFCFTTVNSHKRFLSSSVINENTNLRARFLRDIQQGLQDASLYGGLDKDQIASSLRY